MRFDAKSEFRIDFCTIIRPTAPRPESESSPPLGASAGGIARAALQALEKDGPSGARRFFDGVEAELRAALLLTGSANLAELRLAPRVLVGELKDWLAQPNS